MSRVKVADEMCKGCDLCISVCPKGCLEHSPVLNHYGVYPVRMRNGADCTGCSQCAAMCPDAGIEVFRSAAEKPEKEQKE
jgi:2-oxoglutarate ferredoxin oxidoreductase subunit delta